MPQLNGPATLQSVQTKVWCVVEGWVNVRLRIMAPTSGTIIALDPDIPPLRQRLTLVAEGRDTHWLMDGKPLARGPQAQWLPWPGRHLIQLADTRGTVLDEVRIEVRGAAVTRR